MCISKYMGTHVNYTGICVNSSFYPYFLTGVVSMRFPDTTDAERRAQIVLKDFLKRATQKEKAVGSELLSV